MALNNVLNRVKDTWNRVTGNFLHGEEQPYYTASQGYASDAQGYANYGYQQEPQAYTGAYAQETEGGYASPYAGSYTQQNQGYGQQVPENTVPFPGVNMDQVPPQQGTAPMGAPMETRVVQLRDRESCKLIIEALRNNAAVLLNMESIASDVEKQRCVDMLGGAAYTLNCQISKVSTKGVYMITPLSMRVEMDEGTLRINGQARSAQRPSFFGGRNNRSQERGNEPYGQGYQEQSGPYSRLRQDPYAGAQPQGYAQEGYQQSYQPEGYPTQGYQSAQDYAPQGYQSQQSYQPQQGYQPEGYYQQAQDYEPMAQAAAWR